MSHYCRRFCTPWEDATSFEKLSSLYGVEYSLMLNRDATRHYTPANARHPDPKLGSLRVDTAALANDHVLPALVKLYHGRSK